MLLLVYEVRVGDNGLFDIRGDRRCGCRVDSRTVSCLSVWGRDWEQRTACGIVYLNNASPIAERIVRGLARLSYVINCRALDDGSLDRLQ